jgi:hypothetical protein
MGKDQKRVRAAERGKVRAAEAEVAWAARFLPGPAATVSVRTAGKRYHTNAACPVATSSAQSAGPS